jgi:DNA-directed RNA polymerase alpha subunit/DNA-directed RNA polymerase subunit L
MNFENVVQTNETTVTFTLTPVHVAYANTLRRLVMTGVETIAFRADMKNGTTSDVQVKTNDTPMTNEMLAHRIGLLPVHVENPLVFNPDNYVFTLNVSANKDSIRDVTCKDFVIEEPAGEGKDPIVHPWDTFFPPHSVTKDTCLIATLAPGTAKIHLIAKPSLGTGRENARFQPTSRCSYTYSLNTDVAAREAHFTAWMRDAKKQDLSSLEDSKRAVYEREFNTMEIAKVYLKDAKGEPYSYDFVIESVGPLQVPYMVRRACDVGESMMGKYMNVDTAELNDDDFAIIPSDSRVIGFDFLLRGHDHTFGNMIQTYLEQNHIDVAEGSPLVKITYAGYAVPHPLRDELVVRIGVGSRAEALKAFAQACKGCVEIFRSMRSAWIKVFPGEGNAALLANRLAEKAAIIRAEGIAEKVAESKPIILATREPIILATAADVAATKPKKLLRVKPNP